MYTPDVLNQFIVTGTFDRIATICAILTLTIGIGCTIYSAFKPMRIPFYAHQLVWTSLAAILFLVFMPTLMIAIPVIYLIFIYATRQEQITNESQP